MRMQSWIVAAGIWVIVFIGQGALAQTSSIALLEIEVNEAEIKNEAQSVAVLMASRLSQHPGAFVVEAGDLRETLRLQSQLLLLGKNQAAPAVSAEAILTTRYLLRSRLDRYGTRYLLLVTVVDADSAQAVARLRVDAASKSDLPIAAQKMGDQVAQAVGLPAAPVAATPEMVAAVPLGEASQLMIFKLGHTVAGLKGFSFDILNLRLDLEADFVLKSSLLAYLEVGLLLGRAKNDDTQAEGTFSLVPAGMGLKYLFRPGESIRPYVGLGIGLGFFFALINSNQSVNFRVNGMAGVAWLPWNRVGLNLEVNAEVDSRLLYGESVNFGLLCAF